MRGQIFFVLLAGLLALPGCAPTQHAVVQSTLGKASGSAEMERHIDEPGPVVLETINSADWAVPLSGVLNLKNPQAVQAGLKDRDEPIQVYAHVLRHPQYGNFLVDTGVAQSLVDDPAHAGVGWLVRKFMHLEKLQIRKSTEAILQDLGGKVDGVLLTHLHLDHITGMPAIPATVPLYADERELVVTGWKNMATQGTTDRLLAGKQPLQGWHFQPDPQHRFAGVIDVFGDGSVFAISVPGHTPGSVAYLVRSTQGPVLLTGDTCHTRWGWEHTVEPGDFTDDGARNLESLKALKALVAAHPKIAVRLGHQP